MVSSGTPPLVSVILPAYNAEPFLEESIKSILAQTHSNLEVIIINDGSTDGTFATMQRMAAADPRVKVVDNGKNLGLIATLNKGLDLATGDFIARQDGDDISHPQRFEKQLQFFQSHEEVGLVGSAMEIIDEQGEPGELY